MRAVPVVGSLVAGAVALFPEGSHVFPLSGKHLHLVELDVHQVDRTGRVNQGLVDHTQQVLLVIRTPDSPEFLEFQDPQAAVRLFGVFDLKGGAPQQLDLNLDEVSARCRGWDVRHGRLVQNTIT